MYTIVHIDHSEGGRRAIGHFTDASAATAFLVAANQRLHAKYPSCTVESDDTLLDADHDFGTMLSVFVRGPISEENVAEYHVVRIDEADVANL